MEYRNELIGRFDLWLLFYFYVFSATSWVRRDVWLVSPLHQQRSCCLCAGSFDILGRDIWFCRGSRGVQEAWSLSLQMGHNSSETSAFWELHLSPAKHNDQTVDRRLSSYIFIESNGSHQPLIVTGIKRSATCRMLMFLHALFRFPMLIAYSAAKNNSDSVGIYVLCLG